MPNFNETQPIFVQIRDRIAAMILNESVGEGDALPSVRSIAADLSVNPLTVTRAFDELVALGVVESRRGIGMFVASGGRTKLLEHERDRFLSDEWPRLRTRIAALGLDIAALPKEHRQVTDPIVSVRDLRKTLGGREILHGLEFDIPPGRIYGLVGHNGAGKTTTLNAMLGLTSYRGSVRVLGRDPYRERARLMRDVAFISDVASLPRFLKVRELFRLVSDIHPHFSAAKAAELLEGTEVRTGAVIGNLSKGMLAQLHLAVVMAIDARLLVLDEPTLGLDITYRKRFYRRLLEDYMTAERTLLITTHQVDEIEFMLTDIMFIRDGDADPPRADGRGRAKRYTQVVVAARQASNAARALEAGVRRDPLRPDVDGLRWRRPRGARRSWAAVSQRRACPISSWR